MYSIQIDWTTIQTEDQLWREIIFKSGHPSWHGRNMNALADGWVTGGLSPDGPPYEFVFDNCNRIHETMLDLATAVMEIAEDSVLENGGSIHRQ